MLQRPPRLNARTNRGAGMSCVRRSLAAAWGRCTWRSTGRWDGRSRSSCSYPVSRQVQRWRGDSWTSAHRRSASASGDPADPRPGHPAHRPSERETSGATCPPQSGPAGRHCGRMSARRLPPPVSRFLLSRRPRNLESYNSELIFHARLDRVDLLASVEYQLPVFLHGNQKTWPCHRRRASTRADSASTTFA